MNLRVQLARLAVSRPQRAIRLPLPSQLRACSQLPSSTPTRHSSSSLSKICPSCGTKLPTTLPVCPKCDYIAKFQHSITYHELLGLPYEPNPFIVDSALLKRRFIEAQRVCHPDAWVTKSEGQKNAALDVSNMVNAAYKTLSSPLDRIEYLLRLNGIETGEADQLDDLELIAEVMEAREAIEGIQPGDAVRLHALKDENDVKASEVTKAIEVLVAREDWEAAKAAAVRLKYLQGVEDAVKLRMDQI
ncbi:Co-chaperone Hsc20 [Paxillus ammoniavirescens]|nr:Co-chaperone Hsc20 [Paxillus ammoniavirescens]